MLRRLVLIGTTVLAVVAATVAFEVAGGTPRASAQELVRYSNCDAYLAQVRSDLVAAATPHGSSVHRSDWVGVRTGFPSAAEGVSQTLSAGKGPTGTNLQEEGVDEPDVAKLVDGRIVTVDGTTLRVRSTGPAAQLVGSLDLASPDFEFQQVPELLIVGDRAVVVQTGIDRDSFLEKAPVVAGTEEKTRGVTPPSMGVRTITRIALVDLSSAKPALLETATYDGGYVSARLVDGTVRLVTSFQPWLAGVSAYVVRPDAIAKALATNKRFAATLTIDRALPNVVHTEGATERRTTAVDCAQIAHPREESGSGLLVVSTLRPADGLAQVDRDAVKANGELVYASADRLYVATNLQRFDALPWGSAVADAVGTPKSSTPVAPEEPSTQVHAFDTTDEDATRYVASGSVPGYVLGRWAFSEHEGVLRVATTRRPVDGGGAADGSVAPPTGTSSSMVVKLQEDDGKLVETGRVSGLGKTEEINSVRYFGDLAAVVTFRQTDPLYLIDLAGTPRVLGELKVPGYSTYVHPIGDGLLLAIGMDATKSGQVTGAQVSVFDITDPARPRLVDRLPLGEGDSPALYESRAFSYDAARRVLLLPFTGWDWQSSDILAIKVGSDGTLMRAGAVEVARSGDGSGMQPAQRVLLDDQNFYVPVGTTVVAGDLDTLRRTN